MNISNDSRTEYELLSIYVNWPKLIQKAPINIKWLRFKPARIIYKSIIQFYQQNGNHENRSTQLITINHLIKRNGYNTNRNLILSLEHYYTKSVKIPSRPFMAKMMVNSDANVCARTLHQRYLDAVFTKYSRQYTKSGETDETAWTKLQQVKAAFTKLHGNDTVENPLIAATERVKKSTVADNSNVIHAGPALDHLVGNGGLTPQSITVLGACAGVGKTTMLIDSSIEALANDPKLHIDYFTREMNPDELVQKMVPFIAFTQAMRQQRNKFRADKSAVDMYTMTHQPYECFKHFMKHGYKDKVKSYKKQIITYANAIQRLGRSNRFYPHSGTDFDSIVYNIRKDSLKYQGHYTCIIDHIGLITLSGYNSRIDVNPRLKIQFATRHLKQLAIQCNCPIIEASELNRNVNQWSKPEMDSLMDSSSIETDSNNILFLYRDKRAYPQFDVRCLTCAKSRMGKTGTTHEFHFDGDHGCFIPFSAKEYQNQNHRSQDEQNGRQGGFDNDQPR